MKASSWWLLAGAGILAMASAGGGGFVSPGGSLIERMAEAIKTFEGWFVGSRSYRNNNPGNLKLAGQPGAIGQDEQGHAIFDTYDSGWAALIRQIEGAFYGTSHVYSPDDNLFSFFSKYAEGNSLQYAQYVAGQLGIDPNLPFSEWGA